MTFYPDTEARARLAYDTFIKARNFLPNESWYALHPDVQEAWRAVARELRK
jgi:hypothetical protein